MSKRAAAIIAVALLAGVTGIGCSRKSTSDPPVGAVALGLTLAGAEFLTVNYQITGNGITPITGSIDVTNATNPTAFVSNIPAGSGYLVTMVTISTNGVQCAGSAAFTIVAGQTAAVQVILQCER